MSTQKALVIGAIAEFVAGTVLGIWATDPARFYRYCTTDFRNL